MIVNRFICTDALSAAAIASVIVSRRSSSVSACLFARPGIGLGGMAIDLGRNSSPGISNFMISPLVEKAA